MTSTCCQNHKYNINTSPPRSFVLALLRPNLPVPDRALQSGLFPISLHHLPFDFFLSLPLPFFSFLKKKIRLHQGSGLMSITLYRVLFLSINLPDFFFFTWCSELVIRLWLLMPPDTNPVHYSPTYKIMTYPPPTLWDLPGPWSRLNASFMGTLLSATLLHYPQKIPQSTQSLLRHKHKTRPTGKERQMAYIFLFFELIDW